MNKQPPTTEQLFNQTRINPNHEFSGGREVLAPYTPEEIAQHELDWAKATEQEVARRAATTRYLAEKKAQAAVQLAKVIPIAQAPSYHTRKIEQAQRESAQVATPQEW
jgi:hypothetical protein